jgi:uncharacterized coiled-coil DUF342 family protein
MQASFDRWEAFTREHDAHERLLQLAHAAHAKEVIDLFHERAASAERIAAMADRLADLSEQVRRAALSIDELKEVRERKNERIARLARQRKAERRRADRAVAELEELRRREAKSLRGRMRRVLRRQGAMP